MAEVLRNLIVTGEMYHPFADSAQALREGQAAADIEPVVTDDMDRASLSRRVHQAILQRSAFWAGGRRPALQASLDRASA